MQSSDTLCKHMMPNNLIGLAMYAAASAPYTPALARTSGALPDASPQLLQTRLHLIHDHLRSANIAAPRQLSNPVDQQHGTSRCCQLQGRSACRAACPRSRHCQCCAHLHRPPCCTGAALVRAEEQPHVHHPLQVGPGRSLASKSARGDDQYPITISSNAADTGYPRQCVLRIARSHVQHNCHQGNSNEALTIKHFNPNCRGHLVTCPACWLCGPAAALRWWRSLQ
jgi:hypothetical protein